MNSITKFIFSEIPKLNMSCITDATNKLWYRGRDVTYIPGLIDSAQTVRKLIPASCKNSLHNIIADGHGEAKHISVDPTERW